jgi:hypothetical protein
MLLSELTVVVAGAGVGVAGVGCAGLDSLAQADIVKVITIRVAQKAVILLVIVLSSFTN